MKENEAQDTQPKAGRFQQNINCWGQQLQGLPNIKWHKGITQGTTSRNFFLTEWLQWVPTLLTAHWEMLTAGGDKMTRNSSSVNPKYLEQCAWHSGLLKTILNPENFGAKQKRGGGSRGGGEALLRASPAEHKHTRYHLGGNFMCS